MSKTEQQRYEHMRELAKDMGLTTQDFRDLLANPRVKGCRDLYNSLLHDFSTKESLEKH